MRRRWSLLRAAAACVPLNLSLSHSLSLSLSRPRESSRTYVICLRLVNRVVGWGVLNVNLLEITAVRCLVRDILSRPHPPGPSIAKVNARTKCVPPPPIYPICHFYSVFFIFWERPYTYPTIIVYNTYSSPRKDNSFLRLFYMSAKKRLKKCNNILYCIRVGINEKKAPSASET